MRGFRPGLARSAFAGRVVRLLTLISSLALAVLLVATFAGVIMRYVFGAPIFGGNEIIQLASVVLVMLAMPAAAYDETHIRVDVFDDHIGRWGRFAGDVLTRCVSVYLLVMLAWRSWGQLADAAEFGDTTNMLRIPLWPFYGFLLLGAALYAAVLFLQLLDTLISGARRSE